MADKKKAVSKKKATTKAKPVPLVEGVTPDPVPVPEKKSKKKPHAELMRDMRLTKH